MSKEEKEQKGFSRRDFLKSSAAGLAVIGGGSLLAGCQPKSTEDAAANAGGAAAGSETSAGSGATYSCDRVTGYSGEGDWLGAAPVIDDADITETIDVDVLVLGGGHAGVLAALGASDLGAKVAVIEKQDEAGFATDYWHRIGEDIGHVNSQWLINKGFGPYDTGEIVAEFVKRASGRCNPDIIKLYVENSGPMFDRLVEVYEEYEDLRIANDSAVEFSYSDGVTEIYDFSNMMSDELLINQQQMDVDPADYPIALGGYKTWPCVAQFMGPTLRRGVMPFVSALRWFEKYHVIKTVDSGADWYYEHEAIVLTQDDNGDVTGAIVTDVDGNFKKINAAMGVVVATGDFIGNLDMCWALLNEGMEWAERSGVTKDEISSVSIRNGAGHKMACWAGAMIEPSPRGYMGLGGGASGPWGSGPMLQLNVNAKRFTNEAAAPLVGQNALRQPKGLMCVVTDSKYMESVKIAGLEHGGPNYGRPVYYEDMMDDMAALVPGPDGGSVRGCTVAERNAATVFAADTLEELAGYLGYEGDLVDTFVASIERYNELCYAGVDSDYGKDAKAMIPIDEAPFFGVSGNNSGTTKPAMVTMSGIVTDNNLCALNPDGAPIKGLYIAGNCLGGRYGPGYSTPFAGNSIGMAMTHGWMAGKFAAGFTA